MALRILHQKLKDVLEQEIPKLCSQTLDVPWLSVKALVGVSLPLDQVVLVEMNVDRPNDDWNPKSDSSQSAQIKEHSLDATVTETVVLKPQTDDASYSSPDIVAPSVGSAAARRERSSRKSPCHTKEHQSAVSPVECTVNTSPCQTKEHQSPPVTVKAVKYKEINDAATNDTPKRTESIEVPQEESTARKPSESMMSVSKKKTRHSSVLSRLDLDENFPSVREKSPELPVVQRKKTASPKKEKSCSIDNSPKKKFQDILGCKTAAVTLVRVSTEDQRGRSLIGSDLPKPRERSGVKPKDHVKQKDLESSESPQKNDETTESDTERELLTKSPPKVQKAVKLGKPGRSKYKKVNKETDECEAGGKHGSKAETAKAQKASPNVQKGKAALPSGVISQQKIRGRPRKRPKTPEVMLTKDSSVQPTRANEAACAKRKIDQALLPVTTDSTVVKQNKRNLAENINEADGFSLQISEPQVSKKRKVKQKKHIVSDQTKPPMGATTLPLLPKIVMESPDEAFPDLRQISSCDDDLYPVSLISHTNALKPPERLGAVQQLCDSTSEHNTTSYNNHGVEVVNISDTEEPGDSEMAPIKLPVHQEPVPSAVGHATPSCVLHSPPHKGKTPVSNKKGATANMHLPKVTTSKNVAVSQWSTTPKCSQDGFDEVGVNSDVIDIILDLDAEAETSVAADEYSQKLNKSFKVLAEQP